MKKLLTLLLILPVLFIFNSCSTPQKKSSAKVNDGIVPAPNYLTKANNSKKAQPIPPPKSPQQQMKRSVTEELVIIPEQSPKIKSKKELINPLIPTTAKERENRILTPKQDKPAVSEVIIEEIQEIPPIEFDTKATATLPESAPTPTPKLPASAQSEKILQPPAINNLQQKNSGIQKDAVQKTSIINDLTTPEVVEVIEVSKVSPEVKQAPAARVKLSKEERERLQLQDEIRKTLAEKLPEVDNPNSVIVEETESINSNKGDITTILSSDIDKEEFEALHINFTELDKTIDFNN